MCTSAFKHDNKHECDVDSKRQSRVGLWKNLPIFRFSKSDCIFLIQLQYITSQGHKKWITGISWEPVHLNAPCRRFVSASKDGDARIWDVSLRKCVICLTGHTLAVTCVKWSGDGVIYTGYSYIIFYFTWMRYYHLSLIWLFVLTLLLSIWKYKWELQMLLTFSEKVSGGASL